MTASARAAAEAIRVRLTGVDSSRLHNLLYFAQGLHLAELDEALFAEPIYAVPGGAEVDRLDEPSALALTAEQLNTVGEAVARYGRLTAAELRVLVWASDPWKLGAARTEDPRIEWAWIQDWFTRTASDQPRLTREQLEQLAARAEATPDGAPVPDAREAIIARIDEARRRAQSGP